MRLALFILILFNLNSFGQKWYGSYNLANGDTILQPTSGLVNIAAPTWNSISSRFTGYEYATGGTVSSKGTVIYRGYAAASNQSKESISQSISAKYPITLNRKGLNRDLGTLTIFVTGIGGSSACQASINYSEIR